MSEIQTLRLRCGVPLIVEKLDGMRSAALQWMIPGGSAEDPANRLGRAAMWSELLMRGAGKLGSREQADAFDRLGCGRSADVGGYFMRVAATMLGQRLPDALPLLASMVREPLMAEDAIGPSRDLAMQAIESLKDDPQERASLAARQRHYPSPINRSGMGTLEGLEALSRQELAEQWGATAGPWRSIFAAAGDVHAEHLRDQLDALFDGWKGGSAEPRPSGTPPRGYDHEVDQSNQVQIVLLHDAPTEVSADSLLEKIVVSVLSGGMAGRLFSEVREKRALCYSVNAGYRGERDTGAVSAYVGTTPERAQESLDVLVAELRRINTPAGHVTDAEFRRAVVGMKSRLVFSGESTAARAGALATDWHRLGRARSLVELAAEIDRVTLDQVNAYLSRRTLGRLTIQTVGPTVLVPPAES
ncbi:MAG: pitrilysin family protein [Planctomycetota bacterium]